MQNKSVAAGIKAPPVYAVVSVDCALRLATMLQLEGSLTVTEAAARLRVARSTAHRLLQMLVYRDFAVQDGTKVYHAGPVLELAAHSGSRTAAIRAAALPHMARLVAATAESANLVIRTGSTVRFIASLESSQALHVGSREGMVFPAHRTSGGLLLLAELEPAELKAVYGLAELGSHGKRDDRTGKPGTPADSAQRPDLARLRRELAQVRKQGFSVNQGRSEKGVVAVGVPIRDNTAAAVAGLSVSMPSVRYEPERLLPLVGQLNVAAEAIEADFAVST
jgi:DNA-binding IclR family transcriptional regulator